MTFYFQGTWLHSFNIMIIKLVRAFKMQAKTLRAMSFSGLALCILEPWSESLKGISVIFYKLTD